MFSKFRGRAALGAIAALALLATACGGSSKNDTTTTKNGTSTTKNGTSTSARRKTTPPKQHCGPSGCAIVRTFRSLPPPTVFYGATCSGVHGAWFFNAVEGGGNGTLRPSYHLRWTFTGNATSANPSAQSISVPRTKNATVTMTLSDGVLKLKAVRKPKGTVTATGALKVKLSGSASAPTLTFTETGLSGAERQLGLVSPFDHGGRPLVVPIQHVKSLRGC
jgi:hypothetical protein